MDIYKRINAKTKELESPYWWAWFTRRDNGKPERFSTKRRIDGGRAAKKEAEEVLAAEYKRHLDTYQLGIRGEMTFGQAIERYLLETKQNAQKPIRTNLKRLAGTDAHKGIPLGTKLHHIDTAMVETLRSWRVAEGMALRSINLEVSYLQRILNRARDVWKVEVCNDVKFDTYAVRVCTPEIDLEEEARLLAELDPVKRLSAARGFAHKPEVKQGIQDVYDIAVIMLDTGARISEVCGLTWDQIDTANWKMIDLLRYKVDSTNNADGVVPITDRMAAILKRRWDTVKGTAWVFPSPTAKGKSRKPQTDAIADAIKRAGINTPERVATRGKVKPHSFRDTFACRLVNHGADLFEVQTLLGHSTPRMTMKYAKQNKRRVALKAADILNNLTPPGDPTGTSSAASGGWGQIVGPYA